MDKYEWSKPLTKDFNPYYYPPIDALWYDIAVLGRDGDGHDFTISRVSSTVTVLKRIMAGTSNVYFNVITP